MTDQPDARPDLTPGQEAEVRRLLAEARHDEPIPAEVGDRLDRVLAGLGRDEPGSSGVAPVIDLAARRRRRNAAAVLAGAAAVIVAGFGIGQVIDVGGSDDAGSSAASDTSADRAKAAGGEAEAPSSPGLVTQGSGGPVPGPADGGSVLRLSSKHLGRDLTSQLDSLRDGASAIRSPSAEAYSALGCSPPVPATKFALSDLYPALFDGRPAVVALAPPAAGRQQADVLSCDTATTLATASIPAH
jgi:hypothetical protein